MSDKYYKVYEGLRLTTVEAAAFPTNYNCLTTEQKFFLEEVIEGTIGLYKDEYVELVASLKDELEQLAIQAGRVLDDYK